MRRRQIGLRKKDHLLGVIAFLLTWDDGAIRDDIVDVLGSHRSGKAEIIDGHGRRAPRENFRPAAFGESHQIDGDIDLPLADEPRDVEIALLAHIEKMRARGSDPSAHRAFIIWTERETEGLE